jgi:hypothetical protein
MCSNFTTIETEIRLIKKTDISFDGAKTNRKMQKTYRKFLKNNRKA